MLLLLESLFVAFISHACHGAYTAQASLANADHLALMSFKSHITSDPLQAIVSWGNRSIPMCQWPGVKCGLRGRRRGRVVALDLPELNLVGTIVPELANITHLRRLYLSFNAFHGILPPELGNLPDLETIQLAFNSIQGQIPPSFSNCSRLVEISLYGNKLQGGIPGEFGSLHNLELLFLGKNRLTGRVPPGIGSLVNLKRLLLQFNNLTGEIPTEIGRLVNLNELALDSNQFSGTIPASFGNLSALTYLGIATNNLEGSIPPLHGLSSLSGLELARNKLQGTIPTWLGNLSSLLFIDLQENDLVGQIPGSLGKLELLENLALANNKLSGSLPHGLGNLHALIGLYINNNGLEGSLPPWIFNLSSLETLEIQLNNFSGVLPLDVGSQLPKLKNFLISNNQFHGVLPSSLCNASMLHIIVTNTNYLSGTIPQCLGTHQKNLSIVALAANGFEITNDADWGFLTSLTNCSNLIQLEISGNKLHGVLPNSIGNLSTQMKTINIADNNITGKITEGIGNLINLRELYMEYNMITGPIPASLGNLKMLTELHILNNALSGSIPVTLGNLTKLATLTLGTNAISGDIPASLRNCPLLVLDLSYNNLSGQIPKEIFSISTLSIFLTLPSEVGNLKNLGDLDLSHNGIFGEIPTSIGECESLEHLNVSGNILQGTIPLSLGNLRGLLVLDVSYNNLSGTIPEVLASFRGLSSLNLSFNKFQGEVPENGVFLNSTAILITGNDGLCGGIPQLKLPPCSNHTTKEPHRKLVMIVSICSAFVFVALIFALSIFYKKSQKTKRNLQRSAVSEKYARISYAELVNTTSGFASENLVGVGSFGSVYKGRMRSNGQHVVVAVKVLDLTQRGATQSFIAECETLRCARHRNLVKILTVCSSIDFQGRDFKALVYEFLPNGNLDQWLHQHIMEDGEHKALDLIGRLHIAIDVASSLDYLHQYKPTPIIHCDLKPSNILLDSDMVAHVGDFGLARFLHQDTYQSSGWASMRGSIGYASPEYGLGNEVSTHGDVYSYGILLLEMFTGKSPTDSEFGEAIGLRKYVQMVLPDRVSTIMDQQLLIETQDNEARMSYSGSIRDLRISCITSILQVGICCSDETPTDRPPIGDALKELQAIRDKFHKHLSGSALKEHRSRSLVLFSACFSLFQLILSHRTLLNHPKSSDLYTIRMFEGFSGA